MTGGAGRGERDRYGDEICERCGRCCQEKLQVRGRIYLLPRWCEYLDRETKLCTIYADRADLNPDCLALETGRRLGVFPADCPYVRDLKGYVGPVEGVVDEELLEAIERGEVEGDEDFERRVRARQGK
jgi:hypothetical protein